jgi:hypothetical protein
MERAFCGGQANAVCDSAMGRQWIRCLASSDLTQDWLQESWSGTSKMGWKDRVSEPAGPSATPSSYPSSWSWLSFGPRERSLPGGRTQYPEAFAARLPHRHQDARAATIHAVLDRHGLVQPIGRRIVIR